MNFKYCSPCADLQKGCKWKIDSAHNMTVKACESHFYFICLLVNKYRMKCIPEACIQNISTNKRTSLLAPAGVLGIFLPHPPPSPDSETFHTISVSVPRSRSAVSHCGLEPERQTRRERGWNGGREEAESQRGMMQLHWSTHSHNPQQMLLRPI